MYEHTILTRPIRLAIMFTLIAAFFIIAPILILYTTGYRYDPATRTILQTGALSIDVEPQDAVVFLNDVAIQKQMPLRLSNRTPGQYRVRIKAPGYHAWETIVPVESKRTTYIRNLTLLQQSTPKPVLTDPTLVLVETHTTDPNGRYRLMARRKDGVYDLFSYDTEKSIEHVLGPIAAVEAPIAVWSPFQSIAWLFADTKLGKQWFFFDAKNPDVLVPITMPKTANHERFSWHAEDGGGIFFDTPDKTIWSVSPKEPTPKKYGAAFGTVWYGESGDVWNFSETDRLLTWKGKDGSTQSRHLEKDVARIFEITNRRIIFYTPEHETGICKRDTSSQQIGACTTIPISDTTRGVGDDEWIGWSHTEVWIINAMGDASLVYRSGKTIVFVLPLDASGTLLLGFDNGLAVLDPRYGSTTELLSSSVSAPSVSIKKRSIFFWEKDTRVLSSLRY